MPYITKKEEPLGFLKLKKQIPVFGWKEVEGELLFLIYDESDEKWKWVPASNYEAINEPLTV